jgi:hypothetical protein
MEYKILEQNGIENENVDGAEFNNLSTGLKDIVVGKVFDECNFVITDSSTLTMLPGLLVIQGFRIKVLAQYEYKFASLPVTKYVYNVVARINLASDRSVSFAIDCLPQGTVLRKDNLFKNEVGTYETILATFDIDSTGITSVKKVIPTQKGGVSIEWEAIEGKPPIEVINSVGTRVNDLKTPGIYLKYCQDSGLPKPIQYNSYYVWVEVEGIFPYAARQTITLGSMYYYRTSNPSTNDWNDWEEIDLTKQGQGGSGSSSGGTIIIGEKVKVLISAWEKLENSQPYFYQATIKVATPLTENSNVSIINDNPVLLANFGFSVGVIDSETQAITFYASVLPVGDVELTLSVIEGNKIIDKDGNVFVIEEEDKTILSTDWIDLENAQPFSYQTTISVTAELGENTSVGIANDRPVFFARYGLMVGAIEGQQVTIYAIAKPPEESNTITLTIMREEQK